MAILGPFDFRGGYSPGYDFTVLPQGKGYATAMKDCRIKSGYVAPRWGQQIINFTPPAIGAGSFAGGIIGLTYWHDTVNAVDCLVATIGTANQLRISGSMNSYTPETGTTITFTDRTGALAAASLNGVTVFDSLNNILVGSANSASAGAVFKVTAYNANGAALGGAPPSGSTVKQCNNFMFISRNLSSTTTQSKVYWSNVNDPETWTGTNVLDFNKNDGEPIMALGSIGTDLYIFKQTSIGRLSTVTITTSGAVTLGPLVTVIHGIGCCGPRALDNLPNGNIVFVGFSGRVYEFDGSTVNDISEQPYPGHSVFDNGQYKNNSTINFGLAIATPDVNVTVKTCRGLKEVWINYTTSNYANGPMTFVYNYEQRAWQGTVTIGAFSMTTFPITVATNAYAVESQDFIVHGESLAGGTGGNIYAHGDSTHSYPTDDSSAGPAATTFTVGTTIDLHTPEGPFIPRSLCLEINVPSTTTGSTLSSINIYADYDAYKGSTLRKTIQTTFPVRNIITLPFVMDSVGTNIFPAFLSISFEFIGTGSGSTSGASPEIVRIGKFWLDGEVMR